MYGGKVIDEGRLADTRFAADERDSPTTGGGLVERDRQHRQIMFSFEQFHECSTARSAA
jgi:hypothetical protein